MSFRSALSNRGFRRLWFGQLASRVGDSIHEIALIWVVYEVTGDPTLLSLTFAASFLPTTFLSLPAGVVADRVNRKYLIVGSDLFRGVIVLVIPLVGEGPLLVPTVLFVAFCTGAVDAFDGPARGAIVPRLVPERDLDSANSLRELTASLSQVLFAAGGGVVAVVGSFQAFYVDAGSFFLSALFVVMIPTKYGRVEAEGSEEGYRTGDLLGRLGGWLRDAWGDVSTVVQYTSSHRLLVNVVAFTAGLQFTLGPINVALPVFAASLPLNGEFAVGLLYSAFFTGLSLGSVLVSRFDDVVNAYRGRLIVAGLPLFGVFLLLAVSRVPATGTGIAVLLVFLGLGGLSFATLTVPVTTLRYVLVPDERRGRFNSITAMFSSLAFVLGLALAGPVISLLSAQFVLLGVGALAILLGVIFATQPLAGVDADVEPIRS